MKILVTYAFDEEIIPFELQGVDITFLKTGMGKVLSAFNLTKALCEEKYDLVLNVGTAGTLNHEVGDIFVCHRFVDRDMEKIELPDVCSDISFPEEVGIGIIDVYDKIGVCNTGDSFVTKAAHFNGDVVDMEAFAQAMVCKEMNVDFVSVKYITDIIGQNSGQIWLDKLRDAREALKEFFA